MRGKACVVGDDGAKWMKSISTVLAKRRWGPSQALRHHEHLDRERVAHGTRRRGVARPRAKGWLEAGRAREEPRGASIEAPSNRVQRADGCVPEHERQKERDERRETTHVAFGDSACA